MSNLQHSMGSTVFTVFKYSLGIWIIATIIEILWLFYLGFFSSGQTLNVKEFLSGSGIMLSLLIIVGFVAKITVLISGIVIIYRAFMLNSQ